MEFTQETKNNIVAQLNERINKLNKDFKCPICYNKNFSLADGYTGRQLNKQFNILNLGGPNIPSISVICSNCGFISDFAVGTLGFLDKKEEAEPK